jgi:hypothetical protein
MIISQTADHQTILLTGATLAVETVIETLRQQQVLLDVVVSAIATWQNCQQILTEAAIELDSKAQNRNNRYRK